MPDDSDRIEDHETRLREMEKSYSKINHFTEDFPTLVALQFKLMGDQIKNNRNLIVATLLTIVAGSIGIIFSFLSG